MSNREIAGIMISIMISLLLAALDSTIVGTAMPKIIGDLHGMERYSWPFTAYMLFSTLAIVVFGRLSDLYGRKPVFLFGILFFLFSSALCGLSRSMLQLIIFRGLQGIGGGVLVSSAFIIVGQLFPPRERGKYMGLLVSMFGLASVLGPAVGGLITDHLNWRWVFYVNLPLGAIACMLVIFLLPRLPPLTDLKHVDYQGTLFLLFALLPLFLALTWADTAYPWLSVQIIGLLLFSALMFLLFFSAEHKAFQPILPLSLFNNSIFAVSVVTMFLSSAVMFCGIVYIPLFVQAVLGASATGSGMVTTPMMLGLTFSAILTGRIISRTGRYKALAVISFCIAGASLVFLSRMNTRTTLSIILFYSALFGIGSGMVMPSFNIAVQNAFPLRDLALVTSSLQFFRNMGATIGTSVFGYVMSATMKSGITSIDLSGVSPRIANVVTNPRMLSNRSGLGEIRAHLPDGLLPQFDRLFDQVRGVMSHSIQEIFFIGLIVMVISLVVTLWLKELPLRREEVSFTEKE
ncbi:MAG TPA: MDR family MFS transporter [Syntrophorhabdales bacterium]|nr:MDR family MFS transporter [Syntrophorhabdales bacterium]